MACKRYVVHYSHMKACKVVLVTFAFSTSSCSIIPDTIPIYSTFYCTLTKTGVFSVLLNLECDYYKCGRGNFCMWH